MDWALCLPLPGQSSAPGRISPEAPVRNCSREAKPKGLVLHSSLSTQQVTCSHAHHPEATPGMLFYTHSSPSSSCISLLLSTSTRSVPVGSCGIGLRARSQPRGRFPKSPGYNLEKWSNPNGALGGTSGCALGYAVLPRTHQKFPHPSEWPDQQFQ